MTARPRTPDLAKSFAGGCHCGRVAFQVDGAPESLDACNCSICSKRGYLHWIVPRDRFHLLRGEDDLTRYRFNTGVAKHLFCRECGICSFYVPRSHPDPISVNARCLDGLDLDSIPVREIDGRNWEQVFAGLDPD